MSGCDNRNPGIVYLRVYINLHTVYHIVGPSVDDNALYVGQCFQLVYCNIVRIYFAIYA